MSHSDSTEFWLSVEVQFSYWLCLNHHHHHVRKVLNRGLQLQLKCTLLIDCLRCCWFEVRFRLVALPSPCQDYIPHIGSDLLRCQRIEIGSWRKLGSMISILLTSQESAAAVDLQGVSGSVLRSQPLGNVQSIHS